MDRGPGIALDDSGHLFQRFYRADGADNVPGAGLGLSIADQIARALDAEAVRVSARRSR